MPIAPSTISFWWSRFCFSAVALSPVRSFRLRSTRSRKESTMAGSMSAPSSFRASIAACSSSLGTGSLTTRFCLIAATVHDLRALFWNTAERFVLGTPLRHTLLAAPPAAVTATDEAEFDRLLEDVDAGGARVLHYQSTAPKHSFLRYLLERREVLLHGTSDPTIERFEPRRQTDYDNEWTNAVFATDDPIWPIFFAVVNRPVARSLVNACSRRWAETRYYFSIGTDPNSAEAWRDGWIYVLPRETFSPHRAGSEWLSPAAVRPLARLFVQPQDFPFLSEVTGHTLGEPVGRIVVRATLGRALRR
jgi:hypothetical protein